MHIRVSTNCARPTRAALVLMAVRCGLRMTCDLLHSHQQFPGGLGSLRPVAAVASASAAGWLPACLRDCTLTARRRCALVRTGLAAPRCTFLAVMNDAAVNVRVFVWTHVSSAFGYIPRSEWLGRMVIPCLILGATARLSPRWPATCTSSGGVSAPQFGQPLRVFPRRPYIHYMFFPLVT